MKTQNIDFAYVSHKPINQQYVEKLHIVIAILSTPFVAVAGAFVVSLLIR